MLNQLNVSWIPLPDLQWWFQIRLWRMHSAELIPNSIHVILKGIKCRWYSLAIRFFMSRLVGRSYDNSVTPPIEKSKVYLYCMRHLMAVCPLLLPEIVPRCISETQLFYVHVHPTSSEVYWAPEYTMITVGLRFPSQNHNKLQARSYTVWFLLKCLDQTHAPHLHAGYAIFIRYWVITFVLTIRLNYFGTAQRSKRMYASVISTWTLNLSSPLARARLAPSTCGFFLCLHVIRDVFCFVPSVADTCYRPFWY